MKKSIIKISVILFMGIFTVLSCGDNTHTDKAGEKMEEAADQMTQAMEEERSEIETRIAEAQQRIDRKIKKLNAEMESATGEAKSDLQEQINNLENTNDQLAAELEKIGEKTADEWKQFKANVEKTMQEVGNDEM